MLTGLRKEPNISLTKQNNQTQGIAAMKNSVDTQTNVAYEVVDIQTKAVIKQYPVGKGQAARNLANKRDLAYGAVRFIVRLV